MQYDAVVIGSGVSGLTCAIALAREGRNVLVLEQGKVLGGLMQTYHRGGLLFPTGVHRLSCLEPGQMLWRYLKHLGVMDRIRTVPLDPSGFEEYRFPGRNISVPIGEDAFRECLLRHFPGQAAAIDQFIVDMQATARQFPLYLLSNRPEDAAGLFRPEPLQTYLQQLTNCEELRQTLSAANPLYGVRPSDCPLYLHLLIFDSFLHSPCRIDEQRLPLADAFVLSLRALGGTTRTRAKVVAIECAGGEVAAVRLADGERIAARTVIYTGHPRQLPGLCSPGSFRPAFAERLNALADTPSAFGLAVAWNGTPCPFSRRDYYLYDTESTESHFDLPLLNAAGPPPMIYCSAAPTPSAAGSYAATILCTAPPREWESWLRRDDRDRDDQYELAKRDVTGRVMQALARHWPEAAGMKVLATFTPLTIRDYTLSPAGSAYGIAKTASAGRSAMLSSRTRAKGLFLAGQSVILPGIVGSLISAINACRAIPGHEQIVERIIKETA